MWGSRAWEDLKDMIIHLDAKVDRRIDALEQKFERRFEAIERRFEGIERRFEGIDRRIDGLDQRFSRYFLWMIGIQVTMLFAMIGVLINLLIKA